MHGEKTKRSKSHRYDTLLRICHKDHETERTEQISGANYSGCKDASTISVCVGGGGFFWIALMLGMGRAGGYNFLKQGGRGSIFCSFT